MVSIQVENSLSNVSFVCKNIETIGEMTGHVVRTNDASWAVKFDPIGEESLRRAKHLRFRFEKD